MMDRFILNFVDRNVFWFSENISWFQENVAQFPKNFSWFQKMCLSSLEKYLWKLENSFAKLLIPFII
ncbi:MAG TPA: hypothetical protein DDY16_06105 [Tenacibaculum sp.]|nr:hypothetical protein [Tenacibaculum sp.]